MRKKILSLLIPLILTTTSFANGDLSNQISKFNDLIDSSNSDLGFPPINNTPNIQTQSSSINDQTILGKWVVMSVPESTFYLEFKPNGKAIFFLNGKSEEKNYNANGQQLILDNQHTTYTYSNNYNQLNISDGTVLVRSTTTTANVNTNTNSQNLSDIRQYYGTWSGYSTTNNLNVTLTLNENGTFSLYAGQQPTNGTYIISDGNLLLTINGQQTSLNCVLQGNNLTLDSLVLVRQGSAPNSLENVLTLPTANENSKLKGKWLVYNVSGSNINTNNISIVTNFTDNEFKTEVNGDKLVGAGRYEAKANGDLILHNAFGENAGKTNISKWELNNDTLIITIPETSDRLFYKRIQ